jgi:Holliday junction resolvasome RuvABC DNA-binding subunit
LENSAEYIVGKIVKKIDNKAIIFENNFIGNKLIVEDTRKYEEGVIKKFYVSKQVNIDDKNQICEKVYGFDSPEEKEKFL